MVGYVIEPDELYWEGEGVCLVKALEQAAGVDLNEVQRKMNSFITA